MIVLDSDVRSVDQVAFAPTGLYLAVGQAWQHVHLWDLSEQRSVGECKRAAGYGRSEFRFHPTQTSIYHSPTFGRVMRSNLVGKDGEVVVEGAGWVENLLVMRDETRLLVHERGYSEFRLFDLTTGKMMWNERVYSSVVHGIRLNMEFLPGEDRFLVTENHGNTRTRISVRSLETGELLAAVRFPQRETLGLALSPDGTVAVVVSEMSLFVYDPEHLKTAPRKVKNDNRKHFKGVAFHPSGKYLAATSNDETVKLYDTTTWAVAKTYTWNIGKMLRVAFSADGMLAAAGSDTGKVVVWDVDV